MKNQSFYRISPGRSQRRQTPHSIVYSAFSRSSVLDFTIEKNKDHVVINLSRELNTRGKDKKIINAIKTMSVNMTMLNALLSDAFAHGASKISQEQMGGGWRVENVSPFFQNSEDMSNLRVSARVRLKRFVG